MPAKKNSVTTPLELLQQLSRSLVEHLGKACNEAQKDTEILLAKLEKQRGKAQEKLIKARAKLDEAGSAGKSKAQTKARAKLAELDDMLALLQSRQSETLNYLSELKRDAEQSLNLAQGITQVEKAAAQALVSRGKQAPSSAKAPSKASTSVNKPSAKATPAKTTAKATPAKVSTVASRPATSRAKPAAAKASAPEATAEIKTSARNAPATGASRPVGSRSKRAPAKQSTPATAKPAATKKPAGRKPTALPKPVAATNETADQSPPGVS